MISINKIYQRIQAEIKKCKKYESNNSMDESVLSVGAKERPPQKYRGLSTWYHRYYFTIDTIDIILRYFFAEINQKEGKDYEASSLAAMQSSFDRYLRESNCDYSILNSRFFKGSRDVLEGKARLLREKGLGKKTKQNK